jgi:uncharacterized protein (DUF1330 family)
VYEEYRKANAVAFEKFGARFLVRGGEQTVEEGTVRPRTVVLEFDDIETARACYESPEYRAAFEIRAKVSAGDMVIVEGYGGE